MLVGRLPLYCPDPTTTPPLPPPTGIVITPSHRWRQQAGVAGLDLQRRVLLPHGGPQQRHPDVRPHPGQVPAAAPGPHGGHPAE